MVKDFSLGAEAQNQMGDSAYSKMLDNSSLAEMMIGIPLVLGI